jgi:hypothetical protein
LCISPSFSRCFEGKRLRILTDDMTLNEITTLPEKKKRNPLSLATINQKVASFLYLSLGACSSQHTL